MNIELSYAILFGIIIVTALLTVTRKMSMGTGIIGIALGFGIAWFLAAYMTIVIHPVGQAIFYGGTWTTAAILGVIHLITLIGMVVMAAVNLVSSGGEITWA